MKTRILLIKFIVYSLAIIIGIAGFNISSMTIHRYEVIVNGILGLVLIYLIHRVYLSSRRVEIDEPTNVLFEFPKNIKYFIFGFFWSLVLNWALGHIFELIFFLKK